jgi:hypothetical protein
MYVGYCIVCVLYRSIGKNSWNSNVSEVWFVFHVVCLEYSKRRQNNIEPITMEEDSIQNLIALIRLFDVDLLKAICKTKSL